uniref:hypothetical protein n=1 Tax=Streptomyces sp. CA-136453 TaxID=3240050 RepID=UPI003F498DD9
MGWDADRRFWTVLDGEGGAVVGRPGELKRPQLPDGPLKNLVDALHELHLRAGRPTLSDLARALGGRISRSRLHDAFTSGRLPRWDVIDALVEILGSRARGTTPEHELDRFHALWQSAVSAGEAPRPASSPAAKPKQLPSDHSVATVVHEAASRSDSPKVEIPLYMASALFNSLQGNPWQEQIEDGYLCFLTGDFRPPKPTQQYPSEAMTIVPAEVNRQLRAAVADYAREHASDLGWEPTPKQVAVAWLMRTPPAAATAERVVRV